MMAIRFAFAAMVLSSAAFAQTPGVGETRPTTAPSIDEQRAPVGSGTKKEAPADLGAEKAHSRSDRALNRCEKLAEAQREQCLREEDGSAAGGTRRNEPATSTPPQNPR